LTHKTTTPGNPTFTYNYKKRSFVDGYRSEGITILARDNLPAELPGEASQEFSLLIRDYIYQIAVHGAKDITNHVAISSEIRRAVITQNGRLTGDFNYLKKYIR
jgi:alpha-aminoadipic semialdehyde synthase